MLNHTTQSLYKDLASLYMTAQARTAPHKGKQVLFPYTS